MIYHPMKDNALLHLPAGSLFFFNNLTFELSAEAGIQTRMSSCVIMSRRKHGEQQSQTTIGYADVEPRGQQSASVH